MSTLDAHIPQLVASQSAFGATQRRPRTVVRGAPKR